MRLVNATGLLLLITGRCTESIRPNGFFRSLLPFFVRHPWNGRRRNRWQAPVIEVEQATKSFGHFTAVDHISFQVQRGEIFGFLGANGAGKTTAMRMLCGLSRPTSGVGKVAGYDIFREAEQVKRHIGYMSQKFSLYEDLKVWENIRLFAGIYGMKEMEIEEKTDELLERLGFADERDTLVKNLPLGWKQKLAFSVSIFHEPKIVFLDEPTGGVDPATRRQFWEPDLSGCRSWNHCICYHTLYG